MDSLIRIVLLIHIMTTHTFAAFLEVPATQNVTTGNNATFRCQHQTAFIILWRVNGSLIGRTPPHDITPGTTRNSNGDLVDTLTLVARLEYNQTEVECVARFDDRSADEYSGIAKLNIIHQATTGPGLPPHNFTVLPSDGKFPLMTNATFDCQHSDADIVITWRINRTLSNSLGSQDISTRSNGNFHTLIIHALAEYNHTTIECVAIRIKVDGGYNTMSSPPVTLLIQGPLSAVQNIKRYLQESSIRWDAPFSLNITKAEPDVTYCIDIFNITCGQRDPILSKCDVTEPNYFNESILNMTDLYEISVTPKSNVIGSLNGTSNVIKERYIYIDGSAITSIVHKTSSEAVDVQLYLTQSALGGNITPDNLFISFESVNGTVLQNFSSSVVIVTAHAVILYVQNIPYGNLLYCKIYASRCGGISISEVTLLSTFDFQNITIASNSSGAVLVSCGFIEGSEAAGILIIAYSVTDSSNIHYGVIPRSDQDSVNGGLTCLPEGEYNVLLFVIRENGLPHSTPAQFPIKKNVNANGSTDQVQCVNERESVKHQVYHQGDDVCIECYENCIVIVHKNITSLSSMDGLLRISLVHQLNAEQNKTAHICIPEINETDYQIAVIPLINGRKTMQLPPSEGPMVDTTMIASVSAVAGITLMIIVGLLIIIVSVVFIRYRYKKGSSDHSESDPSSDKTQESAADLRESIEKKLRTSKESTATTMTAGRPSDHDSGISTPCSSATVSRNSSIATRKIDVQQVHKRNSQDQEQYSYDVHVTGV